MLGDLNIEVIKDKQSGGERQCHWSINKKCPGRESSVFLPFNRNKRSVEFDLKDDEHREVVYDLVNETNAVVENFRLSVIGCLGSGHRQRCAGIHLDWANTAKRYFGNVTTQTNKSIDSPAKETTNGKSK